MATNQQANIEGAVDILAGLIDRSMSDDAAESILNAIHYLRAGKFRFNRYKVNF